MYASEKRPFVENRRELEFSGSQRALELDDVRRNEREVQAESRARPRWRRARRVARPPRVDIRLRKPCFRDRRRRLGWYVRFIVVLQGGRLGRGLLPGGEISSPASIGTTRDCGRCHRGPARPSEGDDGRYRAVSLQPGPYEVAAELTGFGTVRRSLVLVVGAEAELDVNLSVGALSESVTVVGESPLVEVAKSQPSSVITSTAPISRARITSTASATVDAAGTV
jgi:hypothetical protein